MINAIDNAVNAVSGILYKPYIVPLLLLLAGVYFTVRTGLLQFRLFGESVRVVKERPVNLGSTSSFGALMVSTASRVGTGNIMGVSTALCLGGPGAIFWMWVTAILGGASAFVESTLAQIYKKRDTDGSFYGGPSYYMQDGLGQRWLGVIFSIVLILTYAVGYNMLAAFNTQDCFSGFAFYNETTPIIVGAVLAVLFGVCVLGGGKRLTKVTEVLVPVMGILYVLVSLFVVITHITALPRVFGMIFRSAFDFRAIFGGFTGSCIMWGIKRGLYSNEAGMGSAPNAAASADVAHPAKQGLVQMLSVFIDTLLICSATAFMCLFSGVEPSSEAAGAAYVQAAARTALGGFGRRDAVVRPRRTPPGGEDLRRRAVDQFQDHLAAAPRGTARDVHRPQDGAGADRHARGRDSDPERHRLPRHVARGRPRFRRVLAPHDRRRVAFLPSVDRHSAGGRRRGVARDRVHDEKECRRRDRPSLTDRGATQERKEDRQ